MERASFLIWKKGRKERPWEGICEATTPYTQCKLTNILVSVSFKARSAIHYLFEVVNVY